MYIYNAALEFGSVSNWNALFAGHTMCYLLRVHSMPFSEPVHTVLHV